jgi:hypothetical protein
MGSSRLAEIAHHEDGRLLVRIFERRDRELVLADPQRAKERADLRELPGIECMQLAAAALDHTPLVVESVEGDYLVLPQGDPDTTRHLPLNLDDVDVLTGPAAALGRFGRRTDDVISLSPWSPDHLQVTFDVDDPAFADVPIVRYTDGEMSIVRGELDPGLVGLVSEHLADVDEDGDYGVFANVFGEFALYAVGDPVEPHHDLRTATVIDIPSLVERTETLDECAARLRLLAERLEDASKEGWVLAAPGNGGYLYPERTAPR